VLHDGLLFRKCSFIGVLIFLLLILFSLPHAKLDQVYETVSFFFHLLLYYLCKLCVIRHYFCCHCVTISFITYFIHLLWQILTRSDDCSLNSSRYFSFSSGQLRKEEEGEKKKTLSTFSLFLLLSSLIYVEIKYFRVSVFFLRSKRNPKDNCPDMRLLSIDKRRADEGVFVCVCVYIYTWNK